MLVDPLATTIQERIQALVSFLVPNVPNTIYSLARLSCFPDRILPPRFSKRLAYCHRPPDSNRMVVLTVRATQASDRIRVVVSRIATNLLLKKLMNQMVSNHAMQALVIHFQSGSRLVVTKLTRILINPLVKSRYSKRKSHLTMVINESGL